MADYRHTLKAWAEAFNIFAKYWGKESFVVNALHEIIRVGGNSYLDLPIADQKRLKELGWFIHDEEKSWARFV